MWLWGSTAAGLVKKKKVVVIGGGIGGSLLAYHIQSFADVVLVDEYFFYFLILFHLSCIIYLFLNIATFKECILLVTSSRKDTAGGNFK